MMVVLRIQAEEQQSHDGLARYLRVVVVSKKFSILLDMRLWE